MKMKKYKKHVPMIILALALLCQSCSTAPTKEIKMKIKFDEILFQDELSGKLIFLFDQDTASSLSYWVNPFQPHPVFTFNLKDWKAEDTLCVDQFSAEWYKAFSELDGEYAFRVILDRDSTKRSPLAVKGNVYSEKQRMVFINGAYPELTVDMDHVFDGWTFGGTEYIREEKFRSEALSRFWGYDILIESAIILPEDYENRRNDYPLVFVFPGFGSSHASVTYGSGQIDRYGMNTTGEDKIFVFMNAEFFQGYHHFADSENNGPWGEAFTEEFLPYIESRYRVKKDPGQRFLMGQSSGAWTALWLQLTYPDLFGGAFAASPDPLDFRAHAFNIYMPDANFYTPPDPDSASIVEGSRKKLYAELEYVIGEFGQIRSWEATFSPRNQEGRIVPLFDRNSGLIDPEISQYWQKYDISRIIAGDPEYYRESLSGKLHIYVAEDDPYGLEKSVHLLEEILIQSQIPADIQYFHGLGHNVWTDELRRHIHEQML